MDLDFIYMLCDLLLLFGFRVYGFINLTLPVVELQEGLKLVPENHMIEIHFNFYNSSTFKKILHKNRSTGLITFPSTIHDTLLWSISFKHCYSKPLYILAVSFFLVKYLYWIIECSIDTCLQTIYMVSVLKELISVCLWETSLTFHKIRVKVTVWLKLGYTKTERQTV